MDENVEKAVAWLVQNKRTGAVELAEPNEKATNPEHWTDAFPVFDRARLVELEAENERLLADCDLRFKQAMQNGQSAQEQRARAEKAEALLREVEPFLLHSEDYEDVELEQQGNRITAHLSENGHE